MRKGDGLVNRVKQIQSEMVSIKTAQRLAADGWIVYRQATPDTFDIDAAVGFNHLLRWLITFTPDVDREVVAQIAYRWSIAGVGELGVFQKYGTKNQWYFVFRNDFPDSTNAFIKVKFIVSSTQSGTVTVQALP